MYGSQQPSSLQSSSPDVAPAPSKQLDAASESGLSQQSASAFQQASQALFTDFSSQKYDPGSSHPMYNQPPGHQLPLPSMKAPYENMAAQGLPEQAHAFYETLSSQAQQPVTQSMLTMQQVQQAQQQLLAPLTAMSLQGTSSQGQEAFDQLTGHMPGAFPTLANSAVQPGLLEGIARQQRVASYNNLIAQAQAAHAHAQAQADQEQRFLENLTQANHEQQQRMINEHAAAGLMNSLHAAAVASPQMPMGLEAAAAQAQHNAALIASLHAAQQQQQQASQGNGVDTASSLQALPNGLQNRGSMTLDGLQSRNSMAVEGMASQHASHQNMLNTVAAAQMASAVSKNGSMAAMNELTDAQEVQLQNAVAEARSSAFAKPPSLPQHLGPADVCSPPFSPPKASNLTAQRSGEVPGLSLASSRLHAQEDMVPDVLNLTLSHMAVQNSTAEKLRREVVRLTTEAERLEKEVQRQKNLREGERVEFAEAKERLKSSWAVDRDDFARVKEQLKKKNAEHHVQNGRLSQSLKESEASCRMLRELCLRSGVLVPPELMQSSSLLAGSGPIQSNLSMEPPPLSRTPEPQEPATSQPSRPLPPLPPTTPKALSAVSAAAAPVPAASEATSVPQLVTGTPMPSIVLAPPIVASPVQNGATSAPTTAAATAMANAVMQQLENITTNVNNTSSNGEAGSADRAPDQTVTAATAAAQAAAALGQLAAALAGQAPMEPTAIVAVPVTAAAEGGASEAPAASARAEEPAPEPVSVEAASAASPKDSASEPQGGSPTKEPEEPLKEAASSSS